MHGGGNRIYGRHMIIHNIQFAECDDFVVQGQGLEIQGQGLVNWSSRTRTLLEDYNAGLLFGANLQRGVVWFNCELTDFENHFNRQFLRMASQYSANLRWPLDRL